MKKYLFLIGASMFVMSFFLSAATMESTIGLTVWYPDNWTTETEGSQLIVMSPDESAIVIFHTFEAKDVKTAIQLMDKEIAKVMSDQKIDMKPSQVTINGLPAVMSSGTGIVENTKVRWTIGIVIHKDNALMILGFAEQEKFDTHAQDFMKIIQGIKAESSGK